MDLRALKAGARLLLEDGSAAEVVEPSADGTHVRVRYLDSPFSPELVGSEALCTDYEITSEIDDQETDTAVKMV